MKVEPLVLRHIGFWVEGEVEAKIKSGKKITFSMYPFQVLHPEKELEELVNDIIPQGINDAEIGIESFVSAEVDIYALFERDVKAYDYAILRTVIMPTSERPFLCGKFEKGIKASIKAE